MLSGISFGILSGIRGYCVFSHFHCGILSHPGACDPGPAGTTLIRVLRLRSGAARRTRRRRGVADIESHNPEHAGEGTTLTK